MKTKTFFSFLFISLAFPAHGDQDGGADYAPGYDFTSLFNTDFVVLIGFLLFLAILFYFNIPNMLGKMLDQRADTIKADLEEARSIREEAQAMLASYERKQREVADQSARIVAAARADAQAVADQAKLDLQHTIARRLQTAEEQIINAEEKALHVVRDRAIQTAIAAVAVAIRENMPADFAQQTIDDAIGVVEQRLH